MTLRVSQRGRALLGRRATAGPWLGSRVCLWAPCVLGAGHNQGTLAGGTASALCRLLCEDSGRTPRGWRPLGLLAYSLSHQRNRQIECEPSCGHRHQAGSHVSSRGLSRSGGRALAWPSAQHAGRPSCRRCPRGALVPSDRGRPQVLTTGAAPARPSAQRERSGVLLAEKGAPPCGHSTPTPQGPVQPAGAPRHVPWGLASDQGLLPSPCRGHQESPGPCSPPPPVHHHSE